MLEWLKNLGRSKPEWLRAGLPEEDLALLFQDFKRLEADGGSFPDEVMTYVVTGGNAAVLSRLVADSEAAQKLGLRCHSETWTSIKPADRDEFFRTTTITDPALHLRLAMVYEAALKAGGLRKLTPGLPNGGEWLEIYLWEATRTAPNTYPRRPYETKLSAPALESMLKLSGHPTSWLARAALITDGSVSHWGGAEFAVMLLKVPEAASTFTTHPDTVRACLEEVDHRGKAHIIEVLQRAGVSASLLPDRAAALAVGSSRQVREAAASWIAPTPDLILPEVKKLAISAEPEERAHAVRFLAMMGRELMRPFLRERLAADKAKRVVDAIESALKTEESVVAPETGDNDAAEVAVDGKDHVTATTGSSLEVASQGTSTPVAVTVHAHSHAHAPGPNALPDQKDPMDGVGLDDSVLADLRAAITEANASFLDTWKGIKGQRWAPKTPPQLSLDDAQHWFDFLRNPDPTARPSIKVEIPHGFHHGAGIICKVAGHPRFNLVHVLRWCIQVDDSFLSSRQWFGKIASCWDERIRTHGPVDFRELAHVCARLRVQHAWIGRWWLQSGSYSSNAFTAVPPEQAWPYFAENLDTLRRILGWIPADPVKDEPMIGSIWQNVMRDNAWRALAGFPSPPPLLMERMWEAALGTSKTERSLAQAALLRAPDRDARIIAVLSTGQMDARAAAADWLGRLGVKEAIPSLRAAVTKEKHDVAKAAMLKALERLGVPPDEFLNRKSLAKDTAKVAAKGASPALAWLNFETLPKVHWEDTGAEVERDILKAWLIQACKVKSSEPNPMLRAYAAMFRPAEREALGQYVLEAWMQADLTPLTREAAEAEATLQAQQSVQAAAKYPQYYTMHTFEEFYTHYLAGMLVRPHGSASDSKGVLAVAGACVGGGAAAPIAAYLKKWYGTRVHQARALLQMLSWVDHPAATQTLLSIGTRFRTKSLQEEAVRLAQAIAERKGWTLAELADRTIPTAGLDEDGILEFDYGSRTFAAKLDAAMNLVLSSPDGKALKTLPEPRKDEDAELSASSKKQFAAARKELKQVLEQQKANLYEAMCVQRSWLLEDWDAFLNRHPIMRHYCQRLIWSATPADGAMPVYFRPMPDGSLSDVEDNPVTLAPEARVSLAHASLMPEDAARAWSQHLVDYKVTPLFDQVARTVVVIPEERKREKELKDYEGWLVETFKLRARATKLGYNRGDTGDGGWFSDYVKRFPSLGMEAVVEFTGNVLPEENRVAAMQRLYFRTSSGQGQQSGESTLSKVPAVLLAECHHDFRLMAAEGTGYDPEWQKKSTY